jgi:hypothetical protein
VIPVEQDEEGADRRWEKQQPVLCEDIRVEGPIAVANPNAVLVVHVVTI